jgi:predicted nucleic acid-binding Zn ribbon protein
LSSLNNSPKYGTCQRCEAKNILLHTVILFKPVGNHVELEFPEICEDKCFKEWTEIFEREVQRKRDKNLFYYKFMAFLKNRESVMLT